MKAILFKSSMANHHTGKIGRMEGVEGRGEGGRGGGLIEEIDCAVQPEATLHTHCYQI